MAATAVTLKEGHVMVGVRDFIGVITKLVDSVGGVVGVKSA